jgi:hypothetical protein
VLIELSFKPFKQRKSIGGRAGKTGNYRVIVEAAHFHRIGFYNGVAHADLAIAGYHDIAAFADTQDGRCMPVWVIAIVAVGVGHGF